MSAPLREVAQLLPEHVQLLRLDVRAPLVDLGVRARRRVDDRGRGARLVGDADEVVEDRLSGQLLDDARPVRPPARPVATTGTSSRFSARATLMPLPPAIVRPAARPVPLAPLEVGDGQRPVEGRVERDGDDHRVRNPAPHVVRGRARRTSPRGRRAPGSAIDGRRRAASAPTSSPAVVDAHLAELAGPSRYGQVDAARRHDHARRADGRRGRARPSRGATSATAPRRTGCARRVDVPGGHDRDDAVAREPPGAAAPPGRRCAARGTGCRDRRVDA